MLKAHGPHLAGGSSRRAMECGHSGHGCRLRRFPRSEILQQSGRRRRGFSPENRM